MMRRFLWCVLAAMLACSTAFAGGGETSFVIRAGRVMPVVDGQPWVISDGVVVVRDGVIEAIGVDVDIPDDLPLIDLPDAVVMPGLVAASSGVAGTHRGDESIAAGYHAVDAFNGYGDYSSTLAAGVTTVHLDPGGHRLITGQGAVVKLGGPTSDRILIDSSDLTINLGGAVFGPPDLVEYVIPPSPDRAITPSQPQRPSSRMTQYLALKEAIQSASADSADWHSAALAEAWSSKLPLRVQVQDAADVAGAVAFMTQQRRGGYIVGGQEAAEVLDTLVESDVPLVYTIRAPFRGAGNLGNNPDRNDPDIDDLAEFGELDLALALSPGMPLEDLRLAAALARRSGVGEERIIRAVTSVPAEILGVGDRVGSLAPGRDADLLIMTDHPLETSSHVQRVYVGGHLAYSAPESNALVVKAGTIWLGPGEWLQDGAVLIEDGRIVEVGPRVGRPANAQVIDAGPDGFVTPGFIDARGHLGLGGDQGSLAAGTTMAQLAGPADVSEHRVARAGVTTVLTGPYRAGSGGSAVSAIKTAGDTRGDRVIEPSAALAFDLSGADPTNIRAQLKPRLDAGRQYLEKWNTYRAELAEWEKARAEGKATEAKPAVEEETEETEEADPISGTWEITIESEVFPEPVTAKIGLKLEGNTFEGRVLDPPPPVEHKITGSLTGNDIKGTIEVDTGGMGQPEFEGTIDAPDHSTGKIILGGFLEANYEMTRIDKGPVEFKLVTKRRRTRGKDGRPLPPKVDPALEPMRALLEKRIPAAVTVSTAKQVEAVLDYLVDAEELPVVLINAEGAGRHAERLADSDVGVVLPQAPVRRVDNELYHQGSDLHRSGVPIAFQSGAEDGARALPIMGLYSVEKGLSAEAAIAAMTIDAARMYMVDDRIGAIAPGLDGDLVIHSGHPFDADSTVERVIVNGKEVLR